MAGYVYLIGTPIFHWYKIGKSVNPEIRIQDLGILLPFKIKVIGIWKAENHHALETELHDKYKYCRINGEWFRFEHKEVHKIFNLLPNTVRIYPTENNPDSIFAKFTNIENDCPEKHTIIYKVRKWASADMSDKERAERKRISMEAQKERKAKRLQSKISLHETDNQSRNTDFKQEHEPLVSRLYKGENNDVQKQLGNSP